jgi:hypothetical protein
MTKDVNITLNSNTPTIEVSGKNSPNVGGSAKTQPVVSFVAVGQKGASGSNGSDGAVGATGASGSITAEQQAAIANNTSKVGITTEQASAITVNSAKDTYPSTDATKVGYISVTQAVDLDAMETKLNGITDNEAIDWTTDQGGTNIHAGNYIDTNTQLSAEEVQDIVGAMLTGNTETNIAVTYQDDDGTIDFASTDTNTTYSEATGSAEGLMSIAHHDKLDGIETSADVTDATNVQAAGALMDSELTDLAGVKGVTISTLQVKPSEGAFADGDKTKLDAIEASADVTDATNVTAAGALMDSEVTNLAEVKAFSASDYATASQGTKADSAQQPPTEGAFADGDKTKLDGIASGATANAGDVTLSGTQTITGRKLINIRQFTPTSSTDGDYNGDVILVGTGSTVLGKIYTLRTDGAWALTDADSSAATGFLAVALGTDPDADGMLIRGMVTLSIEIAGTEAVGNPVYVDGVTAGAATVTAPSGTGDFVRVIGYVMDTDDQIYFNPDNTWVEIA